MVKKKTKPASKLTSLPRRLLSKLSEAVELVEQENWEEAHPLLIELGEQLPDNPDVLEMLLIACNEVGDRLGYLDACERLLPLHPDDADLHLALLHAYLSNGFLAHGQRAAQVFLEGWPEHEDADEVRKVQEAVNEDLRENFRDLEMGEDSAMQLALDHEGMQLLMGREQYQQAIKLGQRLIEQYPRFAPTYNNLGQIYWLQAQWQSAIDIEQQVLAFDPENVHALGNLARFSLVVGRGEDAQEYARRLKASTRPAAERMTKTVETLSYLGDDQGIVDFIKQAEKNDEIDPDAERVLPYIYHLVAAAKCRLGDEKGARRDWEKVLKVDANFKLAAENLTDIKRPAGERHAPWSFSLGYWMPPGLLSEFAQFLAPLARKSQGKNAENIVRRFLEKHPEMISLAPHMLERGDEQSREMIMLLANAGRPPELLELLKTFALGQLGPDKFRMEAAQLASDAGLLPSGMTRMWMQGKWIDVLLMGFEIHGEPEHTHSRPVTKLAEEAVSALHESDSKRAEELLEKALELEPESPDLLNNLAAAYEIQGRKQESQALAEQIHQRFPDYFFGKISKAQMLTRDGETEQARQLLMPLLERKRLHFTEFDGLCAAFIELYLAEKDREAARSWFGMWESANPENPMLENYRWRLSGWKELLKRR
ncbi:MAG: tetratricopeptide repeat protein [Chloroflexota bacterium]